jgi:hypothetical protein
MSNLSRKAMREYQRERRARLRADGGAATVDRDVHSAPRRAERAKIKAQAECFDGATIAQVRAAGERAAARVITEARHKEGVQAVGSASPRHALTVLGTPLQGEVIATPRSMIADGGTPPRRYAENASVAEATAFIRAFAAEQARINAETARRLEALEREKAERDRQDAALEDKRAGIVGFVQGIAGLFSLVARG